MAGDALTPCGPDCDQQHAETEPHNHNQKETRMPPKKKAETAPEATSLADEQQAQMIAIEAEFVEAGDVRGETLTVLRDAARRSRNRSNRRPITWPELDQLLGDAIDAVTSPKATTEAHAAPTEPPTQTRDQGPEGGDGK